MEKQKNQQQNKMINRQVTQMAELGNKDRLLDEIQLHLSVMNGINLATSLHRLTKCATLEGSESDTTVMKQDPRFQELFNAIVKHICCHRLCSTTSTKRSSKQEAHSEMPVQCMSIVAWSCATLQIHHKAVFENIAEITASRLSELKPYELSNLAWAYAKLGLSSSELFKNLVAHMLARREGEFKTQCLSTIAWALAAAKRRNLAVFRSIAQEIAPKAADLKPQDISNTLWAYAKSRVAHEQLFSSIGQAASSDTKIWLFKPQEFTMSAWAFATVGLQNAAFFTRLEPVVIRKRHELTPENIATILWAYAKLKVNCSYALVSSLLDTVMAKQNAFMPTEISVVVRAASQMCPHRLDFFSAVAQRWAASVQAFSPRALATLTHAFFVLSNDPENFQKTLLKESLQRLPKFKPSSFCDMFEGVLVAAGSGNSSQACEALDKLCEHGICRAPEFSHSEIQALMRALEKHQEIRRLDCIVMLEQALEDAAAEQLSTFPMVKETASIGSVSTAEDSQEEDKDDAEDLCWPMGDAVQPKGTCCSPSLMKPVVAPPPGLEMEPPPGLTPAASVAHPTVRKPAAQRTTPASAPAQANLGPQGFDDTPWHVPLPEYGGAYKGVSTTCWTAPANSSPAQALPEPDCHQTPLRTVSASSIMELVVGDCWKPLEFAPFRHIPVIGVGEHFVCLRQGQVEARIVLKRVPAKTCIAFPDKCNRHVLRPIAQVVGGPNLAQAPYNEGAAASVGSRVVAYSHCARGSLAEWMAERRAAGQPVGAAEAARIAIGILKGVEALLPHGTAAVASVHPEEIFLDTALSPRVRAPIPKTGNKRCSPWMSPEECAGPLVTDTDVWRALSFRLGVILYFMNSEIHFPQWKVLSARCDMSYYTGPAILRGLVAACLRVGSQAPPARLTVVTVLEKLSIRVEQHEPKKVFPMCHLRTSGCEYQAKYAAYA